MYSISNSFRCSEAQQKVLFNSNFECSNKPSDAYIINRRWPLSIRRPIGIHILHREKRVMMRHEGNWILEKPSSSCTYTHAHNAFMLQLLVSVRRESILAVRRPVERNRSYTELFAESVRRVAENIFHCSKEHSIAPLFRSEFRSSVGVSTIFSQFELR